MAARSGSARSSKPRKGSTPPLSALDLGIDLGTTRTVVARADRGNYPVLSFTDTNGDSHDYYPSLTALTDDGLVHGFRAPPVRVPRCCAASSAPWRLPRSARPVQ